MGAIKDFFMSIIGVVTGLVDFVIGTVEDIVHVVALCVTFVAKLPSLLTSWLPAEIVALFVSLFAIVVVYKILGREG